MLFRSSLGSNWLFSDFYGFDMFLSIHSHIQMAVDILLVLERRANQSIEGYRLRFIVARGSESMYMVYLVAIVRFVQLI